MSNAWVTVTVTVTCLKGSMCHADIRSCNADIGWSSEVPFTVSMCHAVAAIAEEAAVPFMVECATQMLRLSSEGMVPFMECATQTVMVILDYARSSGTFDGYF